MKVIVKRVFYDKNGLHRPGEMADIQTFVPELMERATIVDKTESKSAEKAEKKVIIKKKVQENA